MRAFVKGEEPEHHLTVDHPLRRLLQCQHASKLCALRKLLYQLIEVPTEDAVSKFMCRQRDGPSIEAFKYLELNSGIGGVRNLNNRDAISSECELQFIRQVHKCLPLEILQYLQFRKAERPTIF